VINTDNRYGPCSWVTFCEYVVKLPLV